MKSVTTCPSCQTQFLVTDEQLSQFNGKVRCGHCLSVFNSVEYIKVDTAKNTTNDAVAVSTEVEEPQPTPVEEVAAEESQEIVSAESTTSSEPTTPVVESAIEHPIEEKLEASVADATPSKREAFLKELFEQANLPLEEVPASTTAPEEQVSEPSFNENELAELNLEHDQAAVREINAGEVKPEYQYYLEERKPTSPVLVAFLVVLIVTALLQGIFFYRHTLAMQFPELKPTLVHLCNTLGCKINLPQEIQYFSIDDSTIEEDASHAGVIRLSSTITNRAEFNQAFPNLEVTLTDTQDHPKLRRIFKPSEYLTKEYRLEEGIASGDSIAINMPLMADDFKPAGFRLLVSY